MDSRPVVQQQNRGADVGVLGPSAVTVVARTPMGLNGAVVHASLIGDHDAQGVDFGQIRRVIRAVEQRGERLSLVGE
ncbi:unnamed protein product [Ilex paraguariensis]|uniref:Uncharacterized protein n=1 Tax=Ilex paraguariensis TaxID=185542 RepID=A0ABC8UL33_9AQUA